MVASGAMGIKPKPGKKGKDCKDKLTNEVCYRNKIERFQQLREKKITSACVEPLEELCATNRKHLKRTNSYRPEAGPSTVRSLSLAKYHPPLKTHTR